MSDDIKNRFKSVQRNDEETTDDIFSIWKKQDEMQKEDKKLNEELLEAKKKAKELKKTLRKHQYGKSKEAVNTALYRRKVANFIKDVSEFISRLTSRLKIVSRRQSVYALTAIIGVVMIGFIITAQGGKEDSRDTLGDSSSSVNTSVELPRETPSDFDLLLPDGSADSEYEIVRISPEGAEPSYTYLDKFSSNSNLFRVTQQKVPEGFDLNATATGFQATDIIQLDDTKIYHGYSEEGNIQSLLLVKEDVLITIRSNGKFSDDLWVSYITSLQ